MRNGKRFSLRASCALGVVVALCGSLQAQYVTSHNVPVSFAGSTLDGIVGSGIPNSNFEVAVNAGEAVEIGLKAIERYVGDLPATLDTYYAQPGISAGQGGSPDGATWNYVLVGDLGSKVIADFDIQFDVDFDPAVGVQNYTTIDVDAQAVILGTSGDSQFGDSQNLDFSFWQTFFGAPPFDPFATGEYDLRLTVFEKGTSTVLAESSIRVVVPTPSSVASLALLGAIGGLRRRR
jgi:hypothetical protein